MQKKYKFWAAMLSLLLLLPTLSACAGKAEVIANFKNEEYVPVYTAKYGDEYAAVMRNIKNANTRIETGDFGENRRVLYEAENPHYILELQTDGETVAFFELAAFTDGSVRYELKYYDNAAERVRTIYGKTVSDDDAQTRDIILYGGKIYYLTASQSLSQSRIMQYDTKTGDLSEFLTFPFTKNSITKNHSVTGISRHGQYLCVNYVEGSRHTLKIYDLENGKLVTEKKLPSSVEAVFYADYDIDSDLYAFYYAYRDTNTTEYAIGYLFGPSEEITPVANIPDNTYITHEVITLCNNLIYYNTETEVDEDTTEAVGVLYNIMDGKSMLYEKSIHTFIDGEEIYNLSYSEGKNNKTTVKFTRAKIVSD